MLAGAKEAIAFRAREWGVYIAVGLHLWEREHLIPCAVVFDANGDIVARSRVQSRHPVESPSSTGSFFASPVGTIGVYEMSGSGAGRPITVVSSGSCVVCVPVAGTTDKQRSAVAGQIEGLRKTDSARSHAYWAVVVPASKRGAPSGKTVTSFLCAPDGSVLAAAKNLEETILFADVPISTSDSTGASNHAWNTVAQTDRPRGRSTR